MVATLVVPLNAQDSLPLVFEENFENGLGKWEIVDPKSWALQEHGKGKSLSITQRKSAYKPMVRSPLHIAMMKDVVVSDFELTFKVKSTKDTGNHRDCCVFFGYQNPTNFYYVHLGAKPDPHSGQIMLVNNAPRRALTTNEKKTPWANEWHSVRLVRNCSAGTIAIYFDDMTTPHMSVKDTTFGAGRIGIGSFDDMNAFDEIKLNGSTDRHLVSWETKQLTPDFHGEGAYYGDFNKDGKVDVVSGPYWYEGPAFSEKHEYRPAKKYDPKGYSDNFLTFVHDFNNDDWDDVLIIGWPGFKKDHEHVWYENPKGKDTKWARHMVFDAVDNESPAFGNLVGDENPELIFHTGGHLGWAAPDPKDPTKPWKFHTISEDMKLTRYAHGLGFGDVNGDGRIDFIQSKGWWEQPKSIEGDPKWKHHTWEFELDGAQMLVYDVDGDGDNDIVTSIASHGYGIAWMEHTKADDGSIKFEMHRFVNQKPEENRYGVKFSQPHAFDVADFNGDGLTDFVVGKRFWAHGPKGDPEPNAAAVTYWFELKRGVEGMPGGVDFVPHLVHDDSGVGTQVAAGDINGDGLPDVIAGNKKGTHIHLQVRKKVGAEEWKAAQPQLVK